MLSRAIGGSKLRFSNNGLFSVFAGEVYYWTVGEIENKTFLYQDYGVSCQKAGGGVTLQSYYLSSESYQTE